MKEGISEKAKSAEKQRREEKPICVVLLGLFLLFD